MASESVLLLHAFCLLTTLTVVRTALDQQGLAALTLVSQAQGVTRAQSSWKVSGTGSVKGPDGDSFDVVEYRQNVSARPDRSNGFDVYSITTYLGQPGSPSGSASGVTIEVTTAGVDPGDVDNVWIRFGSFGDGIDVPDGVWVRTSSIQDPVLLTTANEDVMRVVNDPLSFYLIEDNNDTIVQAAEEQAPEVLDGVDTRVVLLTLPLEDDSSRLHNVTLWIDSATLRVVQSVRSIAEEDNGERSEGIVTVQLLDYNVPVIVPDPTTGDFGPFNDN